MSAQCLIKPCAATVSLLGSTRIGPVIHVLRIGGVRGNTRHSRFLDVAALMMMSFVSGHEERVFRGVLESFSVIAGSFFTGQLVQT